MKNIALLIFTLIYCGALSVSAQSKLNDYQFYFINERHSLLEAVKFARSTKNIKLIEVKDRTALREVWYLFLNHFENLSVLSQDLNTEKESDLISSKTKADFTALEYSVFLAQYRSAIEMIGILDTINDSDIVLNEAYSSLSIPKNSLSNLKFHYLNMERFIEFSALRFKAWGYEYNDEHKKAYVTDLAKVEEFHRGEGIIFTAKNAWKIAQKITTSVFFPAQKGVSQLMGNIKVSRWNKPLIQPDQIKEVHSLIKPGDVFFQRREWYLSNVGLPGFWPHNALYIGRPEERVELNKDPEVIKWVKSRGVHSGVFEDLLAVVYGKVYQESLGKDKHGDDFRILEAIGEGVVFTSLEYSGAADSMAVLRPKLGNVDIAKAIYESFQYQGRPYDFDFDFRTDSAVVCSELIFYSYQTKKEKQGLEFPIKSVLGRTVVVPNDIVKEFALATESNKKTEFDFVFFLDGNEKDLKAHFSDKSAFLESWKRPKWFILEQMGVPAEDFQNESAN